MGPADRGLERYPYSKNFYVYIFNSDEKNEGKTSIKKKRETAREKRDRMCVSKAPAVSSCHLTIAYT